MSVTRQDVLTIEAIAKLSSGGMGALYRWYSDLDPADQVLIEHFIVKPGSIPVDVELEDAERAEPEPDVAEAEDLTIEEIKAGYYQICPNPRCQAQQLTKAPVCWACGRSLKIEREAA